MGAPGVLAILYLFGRAHEGRVRRDWELLLTPGDDQLYRAIESRVRDEMSLADQSYDEAFAVPELGSLAEAKHLLDVGYAVIERLSPNVRKLLAAMATFSRVVTAMTPMEPLRARDFRSTQVRSLARLNAILHSVLPTAAQRYRLRVYILGRTASVVARLLVDGRSTDEVTARERDQIEELRRDLPTSTKASLETVRHLLDALHRQASRDLLWQLAERREQWREGPGPPVLAFWSVPVVLALLALLLGR